MNLDFTQGFDFAMGQMSAYLLAGLAMLIIFLVPLVVRIVWILWKERK